MQKLSQSYRTETEANCIKERIVKLFNSFLFGRCYQMDQNSEIIFTGEIDLFCSALEYSLARASSSVTPLSTTTVLLYVAPIRATPSVIRDSVSDHVHVEVSIEASCDEGIFDAIEDLLLEDAQLFLDEIEI
jgi:hypothetical protein